MFRIITENKNKEINRRYLYKNAIFQEFESMRFIHKYEDVCNIANSVVSILMSYHKARIYISR